MKSPGVSLPLPLEPRRGPRTAEEIESATIIAGLALQIATTPKQRRTALAQLDALKQERKGVTA